MGFGTEPNGWGVDGDNVRGNRTALALVKQ